MKIFEVSRRFGACSGFSYNRRYRIIMSYETGEEEFCCGTIDGVC